MCRAVCSLFRGKTALEQSAVLHGAAAALLGCGRPELPLRASSPVKKGKNEERLRSHGGVFWGAGDQQYLCPSLHCLLQLG